MKKRNLQKLAALGVLLVVFFNIPLILIFSEPVSVAGIPLFYFAIFTIWLLAIIVSYTILKNKHG
ncbi:MAG: hypothetical protein AAGL34_17285 [Bacteroidota bacterium]